MLDGLKTTWILLHKYNQWDAPGITILKNDKMSV